MSCPYLIGLTGDVGAGKSTVRRWLEANGVAALDADAVVHALLAEDVGAQRAIVQRFGPAAAAADGGIDRAALARMVFADAAALADLEAVLHPRVRDRTLDWLASCRAEVAVVEAVKLVEGGLAARCDEVWLVLAALRDRAERVRVRGWDEAEVARRVAAASALAPRLAMATEVIDNTGAPEATCAQLDAAWRRLERRRRLRARGDRTADR